MELKLNMARGNSSTPLAVFMKGGSATTNKMEWVGKCMSVEIVTLGNGKTVVCMGVDFMTGVLVKLIKENSLIVKCMDMVSISMQTKAHT